jgi:hypothetical protein
MAASKRAHGKARPKTGRNKRAKPPAAALRARKDHVRRASAPNGIAHAPKTLAGNIGYVMLPLDAAMATAQTMVRCTRPFVEFPLRAVHARTPSDIWRMQMRLLNDVVGESLLATRRLLTLTA